MGNAKEPFYLLRYHTLFLNGCDTIFEKGTISLILNYCCKKYSQDIVIFYLSNTQVDSKLLTDPPASEASRGVYWNQAQFTLREIKQRSNVPVYGPLVNSLFLFCIDWIIQVAWIYGYLNFILVLKIKDLQTQKYF